MEKLIFLVFVLIAKGNTLELVSNKVIYDIRGQRILTEVARCEEYAHAEKGNKKYQCPGSHQKFYNDKLSFPLKFKLLFIHYVGPTDKRRLGEKQI